MQKEKLTVQNIKTDLLHKAKDSCFELIAPIVLLSILLAITFWVPIRIYKVFFGCLAVVAFYLVAKYVFLFITLYRASHNPHCIVKDTVVGMEEKGYCTRHTYYETLHLYFSYGEYQMPDDNYRWRSAGSMSNSDLYNYYTNCGDEFCLVLSKPHTGKILYAYPTKLFECKE